jgi:hypothetical protein
MFQMFFVSNVVLKSFKNQWQLNHPLGSWDWFQSVTSLFYKRLFSCLHCMPLFYAMYQSLFVPHDFHVDKVAEGCSMVPIVLSANVPW